MSEREEEREEEREGREERKCSCMCAVHMCVRGFSCVLVCDSVCQ